MLILAYETGHRVGAIRLLRWSDVDMDAGCINWPKESDKTRRAHSTPILELATSALEKARTKGAPIGWVFPSLSDPGQPCSNFHVGKMWREIEAGAGLKHRAGMGWHSLRRKFATRNRNVAPDVLMALGGWRNLQTVLRYQAEPTLEDQRKALASSGQ